MSPADWPWPPELDGPIAAPDQHRVIFENDRVRMLETTIRAGQIAPLHTHRAPTLMYVISGSHSLRRDENGAVMLDTRATEPPFTMPQAMWSDFTPAHTLENTGDDDLVVIGMELKGVDRATG